MSGKASEVAASNSPPFFGAVTYRQSPADVWNPCRKQVKALELAVTRLMEGAGLASMVLGWDSAGSHLGGFGEYQLGCRALSGNLFANSGKKATLELASSEQSPVALLSYPVRRSTKIQFSLPERTLRLTSDAATNAFGARWRGALSSDLARSSSLQLSVSRGKRPQEQSADERGAGSLLKLQPIGSREGIGAEERDADARNLHARAKARQRRPFRARRRGFGHRTQRNIASYSALADRGEHGPAPLQHASQSLLERMCDVQRLPALPSDNFSTGALPGLEVVTSGYLFRQQTPWWSAETQVSAAASDRRGHASDGGRLSTNAESRQRPGQRMPAHRQSKASQPAVDPSQLKAEGGNEGQEHQAACSSDHISQAGIRRGASSRNGGELVLEVPLGPDDKLRWRADARRELAPNYTGCVSASTAGKHQDQRKWYAQAMCPAWRGTALSWRLQRAQDGTRAYSMRLMGNRRSKPSWTVGALWSKHKGLQLTGKVGPPVESALLRNASLVDRLEGKLSIRMQRSLHSARIDVILALPF